MTNLVVSHLAIAYGHASKGQQVAKVYNIRLQVGPLWIQELDVVGEAIQDASIVP